MIFDLQTLELELCPGPFIQDSLVVNVLDSSAHILGPSWDWFCEIPVFLLDQAEAVEKW